MAMFFDDGGGNPSIQDEAPGQPGCCPDGQRCVVRGWPRHHDHGVRYDLRCREARRGRSVHAAHGSVHAGIGGDWLAGVSRPPTHLADGHHEISNMGSCGIPLVQVVLGEEYVFYVSACIAAQIPITFTYGIWLISAGQRRGVT
ncbi:MAG: hypothetical protein ACLTSX_11805 [Collinsella sp.]